MFGHGIWGGEGEREGGGLGACLCVPGCHGDGYTNAEMESAEEARLFVCAVVRLKRGVGKGVGYIHHTLHFWGTVQMQ